MADEISKDKEISLYLVQHGEAKSKAEDPERSLTKRGRKVVEQMASWAARVGLNVEQIRHSGKRRAEETAAIFGQHLKVPEGVISVSGLAPNDNVHPMVESLEKETSTVMLISHLPFLSRLASQLLIQDPDRAIIRFSMGGLVWLLHKQEQWTVKCLVPPDLLP
ncbi:MAG: phosphohistidine phosphatase SixA [bacterium]